MFPHLLSQYQVSIDSEPFVKINFKNYINKTHSSHAADKLLNIAPLHINVGPLGLVGLRQTKEPGVPRSLIHILRLYQCCQIQNYNSSELRVYRVAMFTRFALCLNFDVEKHFLTCLFSNRACASALCSPELFVCMFV